MSGFTKRHHTPCKTKSVFIRLLTWLQSSSSQVNVHDFKQIVYYQALFISLFKHFNVENAKKKKMVIRNDIFSLNPFELFSISCERGDWYGHNYLFCMFCRKIALKMSKWVTVPLTVPGKKRQTVVPSDIVSVMFFNVMLWCSHTNLQVCCCVKYSFIPLYPQYFSRPFSHFLRFSESHYTGKLL